MPKLKPAKKAALEKLLQDSMSICLERPFIEAAQTDRRRSLRAMSQSWISYMATVQVTALAGAMLISEGLLAACLQTAASTVQPQVQSLTSMYKVLTPGLQGHAIF